MVSKHDKGGYLLFLVAPIIALIYSFRNLDNRHSKNIIWLVCGFMGYCFQITDNYSGDASRYIEKFLSYSNVEGAIKNAISLLFSNSAHIEIVEEVISMSVSMFTENYHLLYLGYGLFFGYFFSRNLSYIYEITKTKNIKGLRWIVLAMFFTLPPWGINGFNFWTASQIFLFAFLPYVIDNNKKRLFFIVLAPLTHFSFYAPVIISIVFLGLRLKKNLAFYFYCVSFLFVWIDPSALGKLFVNFVPDIFMHKYMTYTNPENFKIKEGGRIIGVLIKVYTLVISIFFIVSYKLNELFIKNNKSLNRIFQYGFFFTGVFNVLSVVPSVSRYLAIGQWVLWLAVSYLIVSLSYRKRIRMSKHLNRTRPFILMFCLITAMRYLFPVLGIGTFLSGPIGSFIFLDDDFVIGNILDYLN